jgi:hypothetical protein
MNNLRRICVFSFVLMIVFSGFDAPAQEKKIRKKDVPQAVISAFEKAYPGALVRGYSSEIEGGKVKYEIESFRNKFTLDVLYLPDGSVAEVEEGLTVGELPDAVKAAVKASYPRGRIAKAEKKTVGLDVTYELRVSSGKIGIDLEIASGGRILRDSQKESTKERED